MISAAAALMWHDVVLAYRRKTDWITAWLFFVVAVSLFPLAVTPDVALLHSIGPGVIWIAALLAIVVAMPNFLRPDYEDGSLVALMLSPHPLAGLLLAKIVAHWLVSVAPLLLITPLLAISMQLSSAELLILLASLALGTPVLSMIGAVMMALTVSLSGNSVLLTVLVLPLAAPVVIFGAGAVINVGLGLPTQGALMLLAGLLALAVSLGPLAASAALRATQW